MPTTYERKGNKSVTERKTGKPRTKKKLKGLFQNLKDTNRRILLCAKITGSLMSVRGTTVLGTVLSATEFQDILCARCNVSPLNLQSHCNGCGTEFGVTNTLSLNTGGLVIACHKNNRDESLYLS